MIENKVLDQFPDFSKEFTNKDYEFKIAFFCGCNKSNDKLLTVFVFILKNGIQIKAYSIKRYEENSNLIVKEDINAEKFEKFQEGWIMFDYSPLML